MCFFFHIIYYNKWTENVFRAFAIKWRHESSYYNIRKLCEVSEKNKWKPSLTVYKVTCSLAEKEWHFRKKGIVERLSKTVV